MPYQLGVTIRAEVAANQATPLRDWLAKAARARFWGRLKTHIMLQPVNQIEQDHSSACSNL